MIVPAPGGVMPVTQEHYKGINEIWQFGEAYHTPTDAIFQSVAFCTKIQYISNFWKTLNQTLIFCNIRKLITCSRLSWFQPATCLWELPRPPQSRGAEELSSCLPKSGWWCHWCCPTLGQCCPDGGAGATDAVEQNQRALLILISSPTPCLVRWWLHARALQCNHFIHSCREGRAKNDIESC